MQPELIHAFYVTICTAMVFLMQAGFACLEAGLTRPKNSISVAMKNLADVTVASVLYWMVGYGLMYGDSLHGLIGRTQFFFDVDADFGPTSIFMFQLVFCGTSATIVSGAIAERAKFGSYLLVSAAVSALIYPIAGHAIWNPGGWLKEAGFVDFAGSTVVHSVGGWVGLAGIIVIGARTGRFDPEGKPRQLTAWSLPMSVLGCMLLAFGWFGFNGGSTLALTPAVPAILAKTMLAGCIGGLAGMAIGYRLDRIFRAEALINGILAGLVGITASCHAVSVPSALVIGATSAAVTLFIERTLLRFKLDDAVGAIPVHLGAGVWGTMCVALFGRAADLGTGLSILEQLGVQVLGILATGAWTLPIAFVTFRVAERLWGGLRVNAEQEQLGLNMAEHGASTEILDFLTVLDAQERSGDLSARVQMDRHTEVGQIATKYNLVLDTLEGKERAILAAKESTENILRSIGEGLVVVGTDLCIGEQHSRAAEHMLFDRHLVGAHVCDALFPDASTTGQEHLKRRLEGFLSTAFVLFMPEQFDDLVASAPSAFHYRDPEGRLRKYLLRYACVEQDGAITEVIVVLSDATEVERLQNSVADTHRSVAETIARLGKLLSEAEQRASLEGFLAEMLPRAHESATLIAELRASDIEALFRDVHTIKGGARLFQLYHLQHFAHQVEQTLDDVRQGKLALDDIEKTDVVEHMALLVEGLHATQRLTGKDATVPIDPRLMWSGFLRRARIATTAHASETGKQVYIEVDGRPTLDAEVSSMLQLILPHLLRNAVDHGIEAPAQRLSAGKPEEGRVALRFAKDGALDVVEVCDDGAGIDAQALVLRARERGITEVGTHDMTPDALLALMMTPGLSTAAEITQTSGRGVGLDAVYSAIRDLRGTVTLNTERGRGTTLRLSWPRKDAPALPEQTSLSA